MNGELISVEYNDNIYFYIKDILGNIIKIIDKNNRDIVLYKYNSWGVVTRTICVTSSDASYLLAQYNPFVFKSYYYDSETRLYYLNSRFYSPELCRFITIDDYSYLDLESIGSISLYCYCMNNPIMMIDPSGHKSKFWRNVLDIGLYVVSAVVSVGVSVVLIANGVNPMLAVAAGVATFGALNNLTNAIYYNCFSDENNGANITSSSYTEDGYINRWDRLDYTKANTQEENYNLNARRYFSEYNLHMWGWYASGWALDKNIPIISSIADSCNDAYVVAGEKDGRAKVDIPAMILRWLGL